MKPVGKEAAGGSDLEARITVVGRELRDSLNAVLAEIPGYPYGPQTLADRLGLDKVLTSRVLKATRTEDPIAVAYHVPGPEPLRRLLRAARKRGGATTRFQEALDAVERFETLIRQEAGDRSTLDAMISSWLPEARRDFELRRKQAAFKALSQLKGAMARTNFSAVLLHPADDGKRIDVVWVIGLLGLVRLRPGIRVKFATRRMTTADEPRTPVNLEGQPAVKLEDMRLDEFCVSPPAEIDLHATGDVYHYTLGGDAIGPQSPVDLVMAEVNYAEMPRFVPRERNRKGKVFAEVAVPSQVLFFDVLVHDDIYPSSEPQLLIYDTVLDGVADINDPSRDMDRMDMLETIQHLGHGIAKWRHTRIPRYVDILRHVLDRLGWEDERLRGYRCAVDYPVYGSQVAMAFDPPSSPTD